MSNCVHGPRVVRLDVLTANIRNESFVPVWGAIHDQTAFLSRAPSESFRCEKNSELQWHIEPGQAIGLIFDFCSRDVVNAVITPGNQPIDIFNPNFARIGQFQCASWNESTCSNTKHNRVQERLVFFVEWTVNKYASAGGRRHSGSTVLSHQEHVLAQGGAYSRLIPRKACGTRPIRQMVSRLLLILFAISSRFLANDRASRRVLLRRVRKLCRGCRLLSFGINHLRSSNIKIIEHIFASIELFFEILRCGFILRFWHTFRSRLRWTSLH